MARIHLQNDQEIDQVERFAHSRSIISERGRSKRVITKLICQAKMAFNKNRGLFRISMYTSGKIFKASAYELYCCMTAKGGRFPKKCREE